MQAPKFISNLTPLAQFGIGVSVLAVAASSIILLSGDNNPIMDSDDSSSTITVSVDRELNDKRAGVSVTPEGSAESEKIAALNKTFVRQAEEKKDSSFIEDLTLSKSDITRLDKDGNPVGKDGDPADSNSKGSGGSIVDRLEDANNASNYSDVVSRLNRLNKSNGLELNNIDDTATKIDQERVRLEALRAELEGELSRGNRSDRSKSGGGSKSVVDAEATRLEQERLQKLKEDELSFIEDEIAKQGSKTYNGSFSQTIDQIYASGSSSGVVVNFEKDSGSSGGDARATSRSESSLSLSSRNREKLSELKRFTSKVAGNDSPVEAVAQTPSAPQPVIETEYITTGTTFYGILNIGVNTDELSPVQASIVEEGLLKGAMLTGMPTRTGEKATITFTNMSLDGRDYAINAVAIDLDTMRTGLADDVDHHTFERYFGLAAAAALQGYAEALSGVSTTENLDGSTERTTPALPNPRDQALYAAGKIGETLVPIQEEKFNRQPTITVEGNGREIGLLFISGLTVRI